MISRIGWFAKFALAGCLVLIGAGWLTGQQEERRFSRWYYGPSTSYDHFNCDEGIEQAGFRNEPAVGPAYQSETENGRYRPQTENGMHVQGQRSSALIGSSVRLGDGNRVGRIEEIMIGESGCVDFMIVSFDGMSGLGGRLAAIPWSAGRMDFAARTVTLDIERERLYEAPIFFARTTRWPNLYESQWASSVHDFFGTEANVERSIERAYPTPGTKPADESRPDENGARPRPRREDSRELTPTPAPDQKTQPAPRPEPAPEKNDVDKTGEAPDEKTNVKEPPADKPENNDNKPK